MDIDASMLYLIAFFGLVVASLVLWAIKLFIPNPAIYFARYIRYPLLISSRWLSATRLHAAILVAFFLANIAFILVPSFFPGWRQVQRRAALIAIVNIAPLCMGGRAPIIDALNIPRQWYHMIHTWVGVVAVTEAVAHCIIALSLNPKPGPLTQTGWATFGLLLGALCIALPPIRRCLGRWFLWIHRAASLCAVSLLLSHVLNTSSTRARTLIGCSCIFWLITTIFRVSKMGYYWRTAEIIELSGTADTVHLHVRLKHPISIHAGCHFYIFFPFTRYPMKNLVKYNFLHSFTAVACWHTPQEGSQSVSNLRFLLSRHGSHGTAISRLKEGQSIFLDGPYGQDLGLQRFQNIILAAKGMGIAAILPLALHLALRRNHDDRIRDRMQQLSSVDVDLRKLQDTASIADGEKLIQQRNDIAEERLSLSRECLHRDSVKKVILFWSLEDNSQIEWVQSQLKSLQELDLGNKLLIVWCGYPRLRDGFKPFKDSRFWMCLGPDAIPNFDNLIVSKIKEERARLPGSMGVITCGNRPFCSMIRQAAIRSMDDSAITFTETEYRPQRIGKQDLGARVASTSVEAQSLDRGPPRRQSDIEGTQLQDITAQLSTRRTYSVASSRSVYSDSV